MKDLEENVMKKLFTLIVGLLALFVFTSPAAAIAPTRFSYTFKEVGTLVAECGGFNVLVDAVWDGDAKIFYDKDGNPISTIEHVTFPAKYYNSVTGKSLTVDPGVLNMMTDLQTGEITSNGIQFIILVPSEGVLVIDVGQIVFSEFPIITSYAGLHPIWFPDAENLNKLCSYFAE